MKKFITILIAVLILASVLSAVTATASVIEFTVSAKMAYDQIQVDLNVRGATGKNICVFGPFIIGFDNTKLSIPYTPASGLNNIDDTNFVVGNGTASGGYEAIIVSDDLKSVKILYADAKGKVIAGDGTVLSLFFDVKAGAGSAVSFSLSATDSAIVSNEEEEFEFTAGGSPPPPTFTTTTTDIPAHKTSLMFSNEKNTNWNSVITELNIISGNSKQIYLSIYDHAYGMFLSNVNEYSEWVSDNTSIATVEKGLITAVSEGTAIITATYNNETISLTVTVTNDSSGVKTTTIASSEDPVPPTGIATSVAFLIFAAAAGVVLVKTKK